MMLGNRKEEERALILLHVIRKSQTPSENRLTSYSELKKPKSVPGFEPGLPRPNATALPLVPPLLPVVLTSIDLSGSRSSSLGADSLAKRSRRQLRRPLQRRQVLPGRLSSRKSGRGDPVQSGKAGATTFVRSSFWPFLYLVLEIVLFCSWEPHPHISFIKTRTVLS